jgi:hypothetical protein
VPAVDQNKYLKAFEAKVRVAVDTRLLAKVGVQLERARLVRLMRPWWSRALRAERGLPVRYFGLLGFHALFEPQRSSISVAEAPSAIPFVVATMKGSAV